MDPRVPPTVLTLLALSTKFAASQPLVDDDLAHWTAPTLTDLETCCLDTLVSMSGVHPDTIQDLALLVRESAKHAVTILWSRGLTTTTIATSLVAYLACSEEELTELLGYPAP
jgi:predicted molibdopterin-dependent oxidoreductase YjgC